MNRLSSFRHDRWMTEYVATFSIIFQFGAASSCISAAVPAI